MRKDKTRWNQSTAQHSIEPNGAVGAVQAEDPFVSFGTGRTCSAVAWWKTISDLGVMYSLDVEVRSDACTCRTLWGTRWWASSPSPSTWRASPAATSPSPASPSHLVRTEAGFPHFYQYSGVILLLFIEHMPAQLGNNKKEVIKGVYSKTKMQNKANLNTALLFATRNTGENTSTQHCG